MPSEEDIRRALVGQRVSAVEIEIDSHGQAIIESLTMEDGTELHLAGRGERVYVRIVEGDALAPELPDGQFVYVTLGERFKMLRQNLLRLLDRVGERRLCRGQSCNTYVWHVQHKDGTVGIYGADGESHMSDCRESNGEKSDS